LRKEEIVLRHGAIVEVVLMDRHMPISVDEADLVVGEGVERHRTILPALV